MPASTHPSNLQRRIHAGGGRVLEQRKSTGVRIHTTPQVGADGKPAEAPHRRAHGDDYPLELRSSLTNRLMTIGTCYWVDLHKGADAGPRRKPLLLGVEAYPSGLLRIDDTNNRFTQIQRESRAHLLSRIRHVHCHISLL